MGNGPRKNNARQKKVPRTAPPKRVCAYCGKSAEGNYSIERDGFCVGPEVDLCDACGSEEIPTCAAIWERISELPRIVDKREAVRHRGAL